MACIDPVVISCVTKHECGSQTLQRVAKQLQLYKPPEVDGDQDQNDLGGGPICAINDTTTARNEQFSSADWRKRRAAVLICLFEGPQGELRVILTKRSMKLSSYPGINRVFFWDFINLLLSYMSWLRVKLDIL